MYHDDADDDVYDDENDDGCDYEDVFVLQRQDEEKPLRVSSGQVFTWFVPRQAEKRRHPARK